MKISYNKLFKLLIDKDLKKTDLVKGAGISAGTLAKLSKNESISMESLIKICSFLNCDIEDVVELIRE
ncbi:MAG: helix-turn-helix transcriptional regulator [Absicoccus sp.]|uniref:helix-turn-helix domain-containing protein n=1 Tax=Absicoccus sp. TaxID=2718527 RepID=UPI002A752216|nr:helix-turn-helix transcriptional regulator [Absicoccus sp.]MDY3035814.1 helix-turn-helix transcriptional regulator [Absicoccus sp.]